MVKIPACFAEGVTHHDRYRCPAIQRKAPAMGFYLDPGRLDQISVCRSLPFPRIKHELDFRILRIGESYEVTFGKAT